MEKVPVDEHPCLGPGSTETATQGVDSSVEPGAQPKGVLYGSLKVPLLNFDTERRTEARTTTGLYLLP